MKSKANAVVTATMVDNGVEFVIAGVGKIRLDYAKLSAANLEYARFHGFKQRCVDAAALSRDTSTGKPAAPQEKFDAIKEIVDHYESGSTDWSMAGGEGGGKSLTIEAIARVNGTDYDTAEAQVATFAAAKHGGDVKKALAFLRTGARVMEAMDAIRKARAPKPVIDADAALSELSS